MRMHKLSLKQIRFKWTCKKRVWIPTLVVIVPLIVFTMTLAFSVGWHATHSSVQRYGKCRIKVPWPYFMVKDKDSATLARMRFVLHRQFYQVDGVMIWPGNKPFDVNVWKERILRAFHQHGRPFSGSFYAKMGGGQAAWCIEETKNQPGLKYFVACRDADGGEITYVGDGDGLRQFRGILSGITPVGKQVGLIQAERRPIPTSPSWT